MTNRPCTLRRRKINKWNGNAMELRAVIFKCPLPTVDSTHSFQFPLVCWRALLPRLLWYIPNGDANSQFAYSIQLHRCEISSANTAAKEKNTLRIRTLFFIDATVTERCRSSTAGHIDVGGRIKLANFPNEHSAFTDAAHRLCNYQFFQLKNVPIQVGNVYQSTSYHKVRKEKGRKEKRMR